MKKLDRVIIASAALVGGVFMSTAAFAGTIVQPTLPAPGILGLVAGGVIATVAAARLRK